MDKQGNSMSEKDEVAEVDELEEVEDPRVGTKNPSYVAMESYYTAPKHYLGGSFFTAIGKNKHSRYGSQTFFNTILSGVTVKDEEGETKVDQKALIKMISIGSITFGSLLLIIALTNFSNHPDNYRTDTKVLGWGLTFAFGGATALLQMQVFLPRTENAALKKSALVVGTGLMYLAIFNSLLLGFAGVDLVCQQWYPFYDPDVGFCDCDDRDMVRTEVPPVFDTTSDLESLSDKILVASVGDIELSSTGKKVLELVKAKNPDFLVINGDLTYKADPKGLRKRLDEVFGRNFPVMVTVGNHDTGIFTEYQKAMNERYESYIDSSTNLDPLEVLRCQGEIGVNQLCSYKNMGFVFSGLGSTCMNDKFLNSQLVEQLTTLQNEGTVWRTVFIHKNQELLQTGGKTNEVGIDAFKNSLDFGAVVMNAHEHQYVRTKELHSVGTKESDFVVADPEDEEVINGTNLVNVESGSFVVVANGIGGKSLRDPEQDLLENPWWATTFHEDSEGANYGAHFCEYNLEAGSDLALCYFETLDGLIVDKYFMRSNN